MQWVDESVKSKLKPSTSTPKRSKLELSASGRKPREQICVEADESESDDDLLFFDCAFNENPKPGRVTANRDVPRIKLVDNEGVAREAVEDEGTRASVVKSSKPPKRAVKKKKAKAQSPKQSSSGSDSGDHSEATFEKKAGRKVIVFGHHKDVLDELEQGIRDMDVGYIRIDGHTSIPMRNSYVIRFQGDDVVRTVYVIWGGCIEFDQLTCLYVYSCRQILHC